MIEVAKKLTDQREAFITLTDLDREEHCGWLNEEQALNLITDLIKVFNINKDNIEVIYFPTNSNHADILYKAADKLVAMEKGCEDR